MGISNPRFGLSMPIGSSYRLLGVSFSDGSFDSYQKNHGILFRGVSVEPNRKKGSGGRLRRRALDTHRGHVQNRLKIRFEHMYSRLRNFHRGADLNILSPLTMQTRIVSIAKMHFDFDHRFSLSTLNPGLTS
jgi:hypothetical protein